MATSTLRAKLTPLAVALGLTLALLAPPARASGAQYRLQVVRAEGAASCPAAAAIQQTVSQRLGRDPFAEDGERGIEIVLERADSGFRARLYLRIDPNEGDAARIIDSSSADCAELGRAVSLAVALAIAPELPPIEPPKEKPAPECPPAPPPASLPLPERPSTLHGAASLRALWSPRHLLPSASFGAALAVTLRGDLFGASFGGLFYPESDLRDANARLGFGISAGFASACLWARTREPQVSSCLGARVGALHTVVYSPEPERPGDKFWAAASIELGVRQTLFGRLFVEGGVDAVVPFVRHRFLVDAAPTPTYEQGPAAFEGFLGLGLGLD